MEKFPMFCNRFEDKGILYLYNELDVDESQRFEAHIANCSKCQLALAQFGDARDVYRKLEYEAPTLWTLFILKFKSKSINYSAAFKKFISQLHESKKIWIPATVSTLTLICICLSLLGIFNKKQNFNVKSEEVYVWTILSDESISSLDQQIDDIYAENLTINEFHKVDENNNILFDEDLGITELRNNLILLSWDINQSYF